MSPVWEPPTTYLWAMTVISSGTGALDGSSTSFKNLGLPSFPEFIPERHKHRPFQALTLSPPFHRFSLPSPQTVNTITFSPSIQAHSVPTLKTLFLFFGSRCPNCSPADHASVPPSCSLFPRVFFFYPEDGGRTCVRKVGRFLSDYSGPYHRPQKTSCNADNKHSTIQHVTKIKRFKRQGNITLVSRNRGKTTWYYLKNLNCWCGVGM
jgi:hypothetical protein